MDYKESAMILQQQTMVWNMEFEDDDQIAKGFTYKGHRGFESFQKKDKEATVFVVLSDRFMVSIQLTAQSDTGNAKALLDKIKLESLMD